MEGGEDRKQPVNVDAIMAEIRLKAKDIERTGTEMYGCSGERNEAAGRLNAGYVVGGTKRRLGRWAGKGIKACYPVPVLGRVAKGIVDYLQLPRRIGYIVGEIEALYDRIDALEREIRDLKDGKGKTS